MFQKLSKGSKTERQFDSSAFDTRVWCVCRAVVTDVAGSLIRLADGTSANQGRLEVFYAGAWGTVCDDNFGDTEAAVACRQLGISYVGCAIIV